MVRITAFVEQPDRDGLQAVIAFTGSELDPTIRKQEAAVMTQLLTFGVIARLGDGRVLTFPVPRIAYIEHYEGPEDASTQD